MKGMWKRSSKPEKKIFLLVYLFFPQEFTKKYAVNLHWNKEMVGLSLKVTQ